MIEKLLHLATCSIKCGNDKGTGHLVSNKHVLTARHCIKNSIENSEKIILTFPNKIRSIEIEANVLDVSEEFDVCILVLPSPLKRYPVDLLPVTPQQGNNWQTFGYPQEKRSIGQTLSGTISQILSSPQARIDIDLSVDEATKPNLYQGISGSALFIEGTCRGIIRLKAGNNIGAISISAIKEFLEKNKIYLSEKSSAENDSSVTSERLADRLNFQNAFESKIVESGENFFFVGGAHGIGKTTYCNSFKPIAPNIISLGCYNLGNIRSGADIIVRTQPEVFFDWLSNQISMLIFGSSSGKVDATYPKLVAKASQLFGTLSKYCLENKKCAVLFVDGINEAYSVDSCSLLKLIGVLPKALPSGVKIVFTAPNFDTISSTLSGRINDSSKITLPPLSMLASQKFCWENILSKLASHKLIHSICEKAQGHPLYLRYLIEHINNSKSDSLEQFPPLGGQIENYYESLWETLIKDNEALNFLAIIARLRWGIKTKKLLDILSSTERAVFIPTISRIQHLFYDSDTTTIYHPSFSEFLRNKTKHLDEVIHERIACACKNGSLSRYGLLNQIYHLLRSNDGDISKAIYECNQSWLDACVKNEVEPDTVLYDIASTLSASIKHGPAEEVIRILLLSQRASFRYDTLFAENAGLLTKALISLNRPSEAIKHAIRYNHLIISPQSALNISIKLIEADFKIEAQKILNLLDKNLTDLLSNKALEIGSFVDINSKLIITNFLLNQISDEVNPMKIPKIIACYCNTIRAHFGEKNTEVADKLVATVNCLFSVLLILISKKYVTAKEFLKATAQKKLPPNYFLTLIEILVTLKQTSIEFAIPISPAPLSKLFSDLEELLNREEEIPPYLAQSAINVLIELGAPISIVELAYEKSEKNNLIPTKFVSSNNVDIDFQLLTHMSQYWRAKGYFSSTAKCPEIDSLTPEKWFLTFEKLICALAWCDGRARRAKKEENDELLSQTFEIFSLKVLSKLDFSLSQRSKWVDGYAIPEQLLPFIYQKVISIFLNCFHDKILEFLKSLNTRLPKQLGLYNEGFRQVLDILIFELTFTKRNKQVSGEAFKILKFWKNYLISGIENRHELVPEILHLIPYFTHFSAHEEAKSLFEKALELSMGPNWYKEDQLSLMLESFKSTDHFSEESKFFSKIAGYLEHCSGEMTFQRYVRQQKHELIAELFRRDKFEGGFQYFVHQSCGPLEHLKNEALSGNVDKISKFEGMRFPGGAIDEQSAILEIVKNSKKQNWRLRWALLEVFQCGDERYLTDFAKEYAEIVNQNFGKPEENHEIIYRLNIVTGTELDSCDLLTFLKSFFEHLNEKFHQSFNKLKEKLTIEAEKGSTQQFPNTISPSKDENHDIDDDKVRETDDDIDENLLFMPGTFGTKASSANFQSELNRAKSELELGNQIASAEASANAIKILQDGGWGIWTNSHSASHREAEAIILQASKDSHELISFYSSMIENEQFTEKWLIAGYLIPKIMKLSPDESKSILLDYIFEHFQQVVGNANNEINTYSFLDKSNKLDGNETLYSLVAWLVDHPKRLRREKAIEMLLWLVSPKASFFNNVIQEAFSMKVGYSPDILAGIIDSFSSKDPLALWSIVCPTLEKKKIISHCKHASRLLILRRISKRAADSGSKTGAKILKELSQKIRNEKLTQENNNSEYSIPYWAECISHILQPLHDMEFSIKHIISEMTTELKKVCLPLKISEAFEIENLVSKGFRERNNSYLNRWEAKVRFALNVSLFKLLTEEEIIEIERLIRPYNQSFPRRNLTDAFSMRNLNIPFLDDPIRDDIRKIIGNEDQYFLHFYGILRDAENQRNLSVEAIACYIHSSQLQEMAFPHPRNFQKMCSSDQPDFRKIDSDYETCITFDPAPIFGGEVTPAIPFPHFSQIIKLKADGFQRISWLINRSSSPYCLGQPKYEGCLLAIEKEQISIPNDRELIWYLFNNDTFMGIIDSEGNNYTRGY